LRVYIRVPRRVKVGAEQIGYVVIPTCMLTCLTNLPNMKSRAASRTIHINQPSNPLTFQSTTSESHSNFFDCRTPEIAMTINHLMLKVHKDSFPKMREYYITILEPLGYVEMMHSDSFAGFGSDHPFLFMKAVEEHPSPMHFALNAPGSSNIMPAFKSDSD
jgi:hypothetical protein